MDVQRLALKTLRHLPAGLLRRLAGAPIEIRGETLDPLMQLIWKTGKKQRPPHEMEVTEARGSLEQAARSLQGRVPKNVTVFEEELPGAEHPLTARIYKPLEGRIDLPLPLTVFFHFGGFVIGSRHICDGFCGLLAERAQTIVVNVEYRLAPEHPFPAPVEDALAAYHWTRDQGAKFDGDPQRVAVTGDSAGGTLAAVVTQETRRQGQPSPECQLLIYPWLVPDSGMASYTDYADAYPLDAKTMDWFRGHYFTDDSQKDHLWAAPLNAPDLTGLPPAIMITAGFDPLRDEGAAYAERLLEAGVPTHFTCYEPLTHAFTMLTGVLPAAQQATEAIADTLFRHLHGEK